MLVPYRVKKQGYESFQKINLLPSSPPESPFFPDLLPDCLGGEIGGER